MTTAGKQLAHETLKHLTTLNSGAILVILTFLLKPGVKNNWAAMVGMGCFLASNLVSILCMFRLAKRLDEKAAADDRLMDLGQVTTLLLFILGFLCAAAFGSSNV